MKRSSLCLLTTSTRFTTGSIHIVIAHFFAHYKDLEKGKWSDIRQWTDVEGTEQLIVEGIDRAMSPGSPTIEK